MDDVKLVLSEVFRKPGYASISIVSALIVLIFTGIVSNISLIQHTPGVFGKVNMVYQLILGIPHTSSTLFVASLPLIVLLFGLNMALMVYSLKNLQSLKGASSFGGMLTGLIAAGCSACGSAILGAIGLSGALVVLPFQGQFIAPLSILLLLGSLYFTTKSIAKCNECFVKPRRSKQI